MSGRRGRLWVGEWMGSWGGRGRRVCCHGRIKRSAVDHVHPRSPAQICLIVSRPARVAIKKPQALDVRRASAPLLPASSCTHPSASSGSPWFSYPPGTPRPWRRLSSSASPGQYPAPVLRPPTDPCRVSRVASRMQLCHSRHVQCSLQPRSWRSQRCRALGHRQRCPLRLLRRHRSRQRWYQQPCVPLSPLSLPVVLTVA